LRHALYFAQIVNQSKPVVYQGHNDMPCMYFPCFCDPNPRAQGQCSVDNLARLHSFTLQCMIARCANHVFCACPRFCFLCIIKWSETENTCPFCKVRFTCIAKKRLNPGQEDAEEDASNSTLQQLSGRVLDRCVVQKKTQRWQPDDQTLAFLDGLLCQMCGCGEDEDHLMICDRKPAWLMLRVVLLYLLRVAIP
jgi:hypothetical protein